ncbi:MAG: hypothetical protein KDK66_01890, partial [Deltaproteobacteria bacterium]|nr:hypothetical protein [Deltaproteobacteria bacterium]
YEEKGKNLEIKETYSGKLLKLKLQELEALEEKNNSLHPLQTYLVLALSHGPQLVLCDQGLAFAPDFSATGPLPLPNPVYCMQDFHQLYLKLQHLAAEEDRRKEALELLLILISLLDGAKAVGLNMDWETQELETILSKLESGQTLPKLPGH